MQVSVQGCVRCPIDAAAICDGPLGWRVSGRRASPDETPHQLSREGVCLADGSQLMADRSDPGRLLCYSVDRPQRLGILWHDVLGSRRYLEPLPCERAASALAVHSPRISGKLECARRFDLLPSLDSTRFTRANQPEGDLTERGACSWSRRRVGSEGSMRYRVHLRGTAHPSHGRLVQTSRQDLVTVCSLRADEVIRPNAVARRGRHRAQSGEPLEGKRFYMLCVMDRGSDQA